MIQPAAAWRLRVHENLASTSDLCRSLAEAGEPEGLAVLARRQTAGRGRAGRIWDSGSGNLALSVLLRPSEPARTAAQHALLAGLALIEALAPAHKPPLLLKWPNDIVLGDRKLAGVLLDSVADGASLSWLVIGFGANLATAPEIAGRSTAALAELGPAPTPETVATDVLGRLDHWRRVRMLDGFAPIRRAWLGRAMAPGTHTTLRLPDRTVAGAFAGLDDTGSLLLQTSGRVHSFAAGEIVFGDT